MATVQSSSFPGSMRWRGSTPSGRAKTLEPESHFDRLGRACGRRSSGVWGVHPMRRPSPARRTAGQAFACQDRRRGSHRTDRKLGGTPLRPRVGALAEENEDRLRTSVAAPPDVDVTVDLCEVEEVTEDGCDAIKNVAEDMGGLGQTMVVLYQADRAATRSLERTGRDHFFPALPAGSTPRPRFIFRDPGGLPRRLRRSPLARSDS